MPNDNDPNQNPWPPPQGPSDGQYGGQTGWPAPNQSPPGQQPPSQQPGGWSPQGNPGQNQSGQNQSGQNQSDPNQWAPPPQPGQQQNWGHQQPGYQQPGYQQPGFQQPNYQPGSGGGGGSKTGLIIGLVAGGAVVLILLIVLGVLIASHHSSNDDSTASGDDNGSTGTTSSSSSGSSSSSTKSKTAVTIPVPADEWSNEAIPANTDNSPTGQLKYDLNKTVLQAAGVTSVPYSAACDHEPIETDHDNNTACTVTYNGTAVPLNVKITGSTYFTSWKYTASKLPITKKKAEYVLLQSEGKYYADLYGGVVSYSCDMTDTQLIAADSDGAVICHMTYGNGKKVNYSGNLDSYSGDIFYTSQ